MRAHWKDSETGENHRGVVLKKASRFWSGDPIVVVACDNGKRRKALVREVSLWMDRILVWRNTVNGALHYLVPVPDKKRPEESERDIIERWARAEEAKPLAMFEQGIAERMPDVSRADIPPREFRESWRWLHGGIGVYLPLACGQKTRALNYERAALKVKLLNRAAIERGKANKGRENAAAAVRKLIEGLERLIVDIEPEDFAGADELAAYDPFAEFRQ